MNDASIREKLKQHDKSALQWLFDQYYTPLVHYALKIIADPESSEEIVQDVFIAIWKNRAKSDIQSYKAYLSRAVRNRCITYIHSAVKHHAPMEHDGVASQAYSHTPSMEYKELADALQEAENRLPKQTRLVFSLSRHSELTYQEISKELDISVKTVEYHISKAFKLIREFIASRGFLLAVLIMTLLQ